MTPLQRFIWGFCGSLAVEIVILYQAYNSQKISIPQRYKRVGFWIVRFLLSAVAGGLVMAYEIDKPILAANVGASAPLIVQALARGFADSQSTEPPALPQPDKPKQLDSSK